MSECDTGITCRFSKITVKEADKWRIKLLMTV